MVDWVKQRMFSYRLRAKAAKPQMAMIVKLVVDFLPWNEFRN